MPLTEYSVHCIKYKTVTYLTVTIADVMQQFPWDCIEPKSEKKGLHFEDCHICPEDLSGLSHLITNLVTRDMIFIITHPSIIHRQWCALYEFSSRQIRGKYINIQQADPSRGFNADITLYLQYDNFTQIPRVYRPIKHLLDWNKMKTPNKLCLSFLIF